MVVETAEPALANTAGDSVRHGACGILSGKDGLPHCYTLYSDGEPPRPIKTKETGITIRRRSRKRLRDEEGVVIFPDSNLRTYRRSP